MSASPLTRRSSDAIELYPRVTSTSEADFVDKHRHYAKSETSHDAIVTYGDPQPALAIGTSKEKWEAIKAVAPADLRAEEATDKKPDGIYAWMVIFACFISLMLSIGINDAYGVYQQHYQLN
ncbi:hypothetical protein LPJ57_004004, partial [Coemansia sp. RSA 486]